MDIASILRAYNAALHGARYRSELQAIGEDFWFKHGDRPEIAGLIYNTHCARVAGNGSPYECDEALAKAIREHSHA